MFQELRLEVNTPCNFSCEHCYTNKHGPKPLPVDEFVRLIKRAASEGATDLSLTGGEPLLALERSLELVRAGSRAGLRVRLNTNAFLLDETVAAQLEQAGLSEIQISLNSAVARDFDQFVRHEGAFARVERAVRESVRVGLWVSIRFSLMVRNCMYLVPTFYLARDWGAQKFKVRALVQVSGIREDAGVEGRDLVRQQLSNLLDASEGSSLEVSIADNGLGPTIPAGVSNCQKNYCKCGTQAIFVSADGEIHPCPFLREESAYLLGNLKQDDLFDVYANSVKLKEFIGEHTSGLGGNECTHSCRAAELALGQESDAAMVLITRRPTYA